MSRSHEDAQWLVANGQERHVAPGELLIDESEAADTVYVVLEGSFELEGRESLRLGGGKVAGPPSITGRAARRVVAATDAVVWAVPRERLQAQIESDGGMLSRFRKVAAALTLDWIRMLRERQHDAHAVDAGAENEEVYRLIEGMLRGELPSPDDADDPDAGSRSKPRGRRGGAERGKGQIRGLDEGHGSGDGGRSNPRSRRPDDGNGGSDA